MEYKRAIGYIRVSTDKQAETGHSLENQKDKIKAYCAFHGLSLVDIISDEGFSGRKTANRPGFNQVMGKVRSQEVDAVIVYSLSRFARNTRAMLEAVDTMIKHKVEFHSLCEKIDTASASGKFFLTVISAIAEMESMQTSERVRDVARDRKAKQKTYVGNLYGFDKVFEDKVKKTNGRLIASAEIETVKRIFAMRHQGSSLYGIASSLNTENVQTKKGASWYPSTVRQILNNNVYHTHIR